MADNAATFSWMEAQFSDLKSEAERAISELETKALSYYNPAVTQAGFDNNPSWDITRGREVTLASMGDLPASRPEFLPPAFVFNPEDYINADQLQKFSYTSDFFDNFLDERLREYIDSPGYFLDQAVQDALFQQTHERDMQALNDALDAVDRSQARRGFPAPSSMYLAARNEIIKKYQDTMADRNKEITALIADKSLQEKLAAIESGVRMEDIRSRFQLEYSRMYWQAADYLIKKYEVDVRSALATFEADLKMVMAKTEVDGKMADYDLEYEKMDSQKELARLQASLDEMKGNIETWTLHFKAGMEAAQASVNFYSSAAVGATSAVNAIDYVDKTAG